jgi:cbb3-type cytochrome oxidase maturation protein
MIVIYLLIPLSILIAVGFLAAFIWAVRSGQYEDTHTPSLRMLWEARGPHEKAPPAAPPAKPNRKHPDKE